MRTFTRLILMTAATSLLAAVLYPGSAHAQDAHYWDNQYGTKAELLGGLVVGSSTDLSSTFYNPGWIALQQGPSALLTTKAAEIYAINVENRLGQGTNPSHTVVTPSPGYLAGRFSLGEDYGWKWAYTFLQKTKFEFDASGVRIDQDLNPPPAGNFWFSGEGYHATSVDESWYGISLSHKIRDNVALGFSPYAAVRNQRTRVQVAAQGLDALANHAEAYQVDDLKYWHARMLLKVGLAAEWERWSAGLAITTASLGIMGDGSVFQTKAFSGDYDPDNPGLDPAYLQADQQEDLTAVWKSPLSIAGGGAFDFGATKIHFTAEWFNSVGRFAVLDPVPYEVQSEPGKFERFAVEHGAESVLNYGLGLDHVLTESFSLFTSYRVDHATTPDDFGETLSISSWDLSHVTGGASFELLSFEFTAGLQYSWGDGLSDEFLNFGEEEFGNVVTEPVAHRVTYKRLKALLGFNLPFLVPGSGH